MISFFLLSCFFALPASAQSRASNRDAERAFNFAKANLENNMAASAVDLFRAFLEDYPQSPQAGEARYGLARALELTNDTDAIDAYREYLRLHGSEQHVADARYGLAQALYTAGRWSEARAAYSDFATRHPAHELVWHARYYEGQALLKLQRPLEARPLFLQVADSAPLPLKADASFAAAGALYQAGNLPEASEALSVIGRSFPGTEAAARADGLLGDIFYRQGNFVEARRRYTRALAASAQISNADELLFWKAWSAIRSGDTAAGTADLMALSEKYPSSRRASDALRHAARLSETAGDTPTALRALKKQADITSNPDEAAEAHYDAGRIQFQSRAFAGAREELDKVLLLDKSWRAEAEYLLGLIEMEEGNFPAAESYLRSAEQKSLGTPLEEDIIIARLGLMRRSGNTAGYSTLLQQLEKSKSPALARTIKVGADMLEATGDLEGAAREYGKLVDRFSGSTDAVDALFRLGLIRYQQSRYTDAESSFLKFVENVSNVSQVSNSPAVHPLLDDAWYWIGFSRYQTERMLPAIEAFRHAAAIPGADQRISAMLRAGNALFNLKRYDDAIDAYNEVIATQDADSASRFDAMFNRSDALRNLGKTDEARAGYLDVRAKGGTDYEQALLNAAAVLEDAGRNGAAADAYEKYAPEFVAVGRSEEAWIKAGILRAKLRNETAALSNFEKVVCLAGPLSPDALYKIGEIALGSGDTNQASKTFSTAAESYPNSLYGRRAMLKKALLENKPESAVLILENLIKAAPDDAASAEARLRIGVFAHQAGHIDSAFAYFRMALEDLPDGDNLAEAKLHLASVYFARRSFASARSQAQYIFRSPLYADSPFRAEAGLLLGKILLSSNQKPEALKVLKEVADKYPQLSTEARRLIAAGGQ